MATYLTVLLYFQLFRICSTIRSTAFLRRTYYVQYNIQPVDMIDSFTGLSTNPIGLPGQAGHEKSFFERNFP